MPVQFVPREPLRIGFGIGSGIAFGLGIMGSGSGSGLGSGRGQRTEAGKPYGSVGWRTEERGQGVRL